jgi:hypothetical protein
MNKIQPIGSISILDVSESQIPTALVAWILAFNAEWLDVNNEEHIVNPYTEVSEINLNRIDNPTQQREYLSVINQFRDLCETFNCQYIRLI